MSDASFPCRGRKGCLNCPILFFIERLDLAFAFYDEPHGYALHAAGGKAIAHLPPEEGRESVTYEAVQHAPRLLGIHQVDVDLAGIF